MPGHNLRIAGLLAAGLLASRDLPAEPEAVSAPAKVEISGPHRVFLSKVARRTIHDALRGTSYEPEYVPEPLANLEAEVVVRLRHHGYLLGVGLGGPGSVVRATCDAARAAWDTLHADAEVDREVVDEWLVEIEVPGPTAPLPAGLDWTDARTIDDYIEPGIHGVFVKTGERSRRVCPSEIVSSDLSVAEAMKLLAQGLQLSAGQISQTPLMRFRTLHWYESADRVVVSLHRGLTPLAPQAVSAVGLKEVIDRIAEYMAYRQRGSGLFTYEFLPGADRYSEEDNTVRQAGPALAMAVHARWSGWSGSLAAADAAIAHHVQGISDVPAATRASFIATADGKNKLGVTALIALALANHPHAARFEEQRQRLLGGMLTLQRPSGMFMTAFPPAVEVRGQNYFPGEALLALADEYDRQPSSAILEAFDRAIDFYRDYFEASRSPAFVTWQVQAFALMARHTKRKDYIDYVFSLTDFLAERQLTAANCPWPELHGGIASRGDGQVGASTASYLQAFADALALARRIDDGQRVRRYEALVEEAARFVMQLQFRPEEAYFVRSPQDAVGGIREAPALNKLRIDHCQHALVGLIKAHQVLFPTDG